MHDVVALVLGDARVGGHVGEGGERLEVIFRNDPEDRSVELERLTDFVKFPSFGAVGNVRSWKR